MARRDGEVAAVATVQELRAQALEAEPAVLGITIAAGDANIWSLMMETAYPEAVATLVALVDGSASIYYSNGGGVIGGGAHASVRQCVASLITAARSQVRDLTPTATTPLPELGRVRFYARVPGLILTADAAEEDLGERRHVLSPVFYAAHEVIHALLETSER